MRLIFRGDTKAFSSEGRGIGSRRATACCTSCFRDGRWFGQTGEVISFHQLIGAGGKEGARETFERLIAQLVRLRYRSVRRVDANPGDWGLDVIVGEIDGVVSV